MDRSCGLRGMSFVVSDRGRRKDSCLSALKTKPELSNAIVTPDFFEEDPTCSITEEPFLLIEGEVQNSDSVVLIKAQRNFSTCAARSCVGSRVARFPLSCHDQLSHYWQPQRRPKTKGTCLQLRRFRRDDATHWFASLRIPSQRLVSHALLNFKSPPWFVRIARFVDVRLANHSPAWRFDVGFGSA